MDKRIRFKRTLLKVASPSLQSLGYEFVELPEWAGVGSFFFRKHLGNNVYAFISFDLLRWHPSSSGAESMPRRFRVTLWRNIGDQPKLGYGDDSYEGWLNVPLSYLLWAMLGIKVYPSQYYQWEFFTSENLEVQLRDAVEKLVQYGIPWLENPASRNP